ncbi:MAG: TatD family hydrolase [Dokdonella sp.]
MLVIDSHCHLDAAEFDGDRDAVIARARLAGVGVQIVPAVALSGFSRLKALCASTSGLHAAYGLHPMFLAEHRPDHLDALRMWIEAEHPIAVGECGLDFFVDTLDADTQRMYLLRQLMLAREFDLPVILHARRAVEEIIATVRAVGGLRGVVHSYSGSPEQARQLWNLGFCLGFGGPVTYGRAHRLRAIVAQMPVEFLLLETDAPDQPLSTHRGQRNEPGYLTEVLDCVAALRKTDPQSLATATTRNAQRLFGLAPHTRNLDPRT